MKICYGIEIRGGVAVIVRAEMTRGGVVSAVVAPDRVESGAFCAGCLSARESFTRWLEVPFASQSKALRVLPAVLDVQLPFALEDCYSEYIEFKRTATGLGALAVAARITDIEAKLKAYKALGFDVCSLDQESVALWTQSLEKLPCADGVDLPRALLYLSDDRTVLVMGRGNEFISGHSVRADDTGQIRRFLEAGLKDAGGSSIRWIVVGPCAGDADRIARIIQSAGEVWAGKVTVPDNPETFLAHALAVRALTHGEMRCNLRGGDLAHPLVVSTQRRQMLRPVVLSLLAGIILVAVNAVAGIMMERRAVEADKVIAEMASRVAGYRIAARGKDAIAVAERTVSEYAAKAKPFLGAFSGSLTETINSIVKIGGEHGLEYEMIQVEKLLPSGPGSGPVPSISGGALLIKGTAGGWNGCDALMVYLRKQGYQVILDRKNALEDERIPFVIKEGK